MKPARIAILISGRGTNMQALLDACASDNYPAEVAIVISNRPKAAGLQRAIDVGVTVAVVDNKDFETREAFDEALSERLKLAEVDYVCLAGFMRILTPQFVSDWYGRLINIHPSLLPSFKGLHVHERMISAGVKIGGCTVHFVSAEMDDGPIIGQAAVPVLPNDTPETLAARILEQEHRLYPQALRIVIENKARLSGGLVILDNAAAGDGALINPSVS